MKEKAAVTEEETKENKAPNVPQSTAAKLFKTKVEKPKPEIE